jgi:hypothetical protein
MPILDDVVDLLISVFDELIRGSPLNIHSLSIAGLTLLNLPQRINRFFLRKNFEK